jgi:DNA-binding transcriptional LysR family regulator
VDANRLLLFDAVVRAGSFAAASRELGMSRQSVSEQIARLEAELGVRLLDRTTRSLHITDAGERLRARSRLVTDLIREAEADVAGLQDRPVGRLRVSVPGAFGRLYMASIAARLLERHAGLTIEVHITDRSVNLVDEGFDAAIRVGDLDDSSMVRRKVATERLMFVASSALVDRHGPPTVDALRTYPTIGFRADETWSLGAQTTPIEPLLVLDDLQAVAAAVREGIGLARLPAFAVAGDLADGRLRTFFDRDAGSTREIWVVHPSRRMVPAKVRCFIEAIAEHARAVFGDAPSRRRG